MIEIDPPVAVGTPVARRPPHRSARTDFRCFGYQLLLAVTYTIC